MTADSERRNPLFADLVRFRRDLTTSEDDDALVMDHDDGDWILDGQYERIVDAMPTGVLIVGVLRDVYRNPTGFKLLKVNAASVQLLRIDEDVLLTRPLLDVLPGGKDAWDQAVRGVAVRGHPVREVAYSAIANRYFDVSVFRTTRDVLIVTLGDIREPTKRATNDEGGEVLFQGILEAARVAVCRFLPDGSLTYANPAYRSQFADESETLLGHCFLKQVPLTQRNTVQGRLRALSPDAPNVSCDHEVLQNGESRWYTWNDVGLFDKLGELVEIQSIGYDITDVRHRTEQQQSLQGNLEDLLEHRAAEVARLNQELLAAIDQREAMAGDLSRIQDELNYAVDRAMGGDIRLCGRCHRVNDDEGHWMPVDMFLRTHSAATIETDTCPYCKKKK